MIQLTRLNKSVFIVNSSLIALVEQSPDTIVTLVNGEKLLVRESAQQIVRLVIAFRRELLQGGFPSGGAIGVSPDTESEDADAYRGATAVLREKNKEGCRGQG